MNGFFTITLLGNIYYSKARNKYDFIDRLLEYLNRTPLNISYSYGIDIELDNNFNKITIYLVNNKTQETEYFDSGFLIEISEESLNKFNQIL